MKLYLMRHCEAEAGERMDPTRPLTSVGRDQVRTMAEFLVRQIGRVDMVLCTGFVRGRDTANPMAEALGCENVIETPMLEPNVKPADAWKEIKFLAGEGNEEVLAVAHHPLISDLVEYLTGAKTDDLHYSHGTIVHVHDQPDAGSTVLAWMVTPKMVERDEEHAVIESALALTESVLASLGVQIDEKGKGTYTYDTILAKRVVEGASKSGPCDDCDENIDAGWIDSEDVYPSGDDGPPFHVNCVCEEEYKEKRVRVPV
jgi:phosphohistidine phosphatase